MIYLASPYTHEDPAVQEQRYRDAVKTCSYLMKRGVLVFSPIVYSHPIIVEGGLAGDWERWKEFDLFFLRKCREFRILMLEGWKDSVGIKEETAWAEDHRIMVYHMEPVE